MREGNAERGFTLIELMIVVAIVAILAAVVVPSWMASSTKSKSRSEVNAMFAEIAAKQEQYKAEVGYYMGNTSGANKVGTTSCPTSGAPTSDYNWSTTCNTSGTAWTLLRIVPSSQSLRCQYTITTNIGGTTMTPPTGFKNSQGALNTAEPTLTGSWWQLYAQCDGTGTGGTNGEFYMSSVDRKIQSKNEAY